MTSAGVDYWVEVASEDGSVQTVSNRAGIGNYVIEIVGNVAGSADGAGDITDQLEDGDFNPRGAWDFDVAPTVNGTPVGSGSGGASLTEVRAVINDENHTPDGTWNFVQTPTVNGTPLGTGTLQEVTLENMPAGTAVVVSFSDVDGWPDRPTAREDISISWSSGPFPEATEPPQAVPGIDTWQRDMTIDDAMPGTPVYMFYNDGTSTWPVRATTRDDVVGVWIGATEDDPPPSGELVTGVDIWIRSQV